MIGIGRHGGSSYQVVNNGHVPELLELPEELHVTYSSKASMLIIHSLTK